MQLSSGKLPRKHTESQLVTSCEKKKHSMVEYMQFDEVSDPTMISCLTDSLWT